MKDMHKFLDNHCKHAVFESNGGIFWCECKLKDCAITPAQCERCKDKDREDSK